MEYENIMGWLLELGIKAKTQTKYLINDFIKPNCTLPEESIMCFHGIDDIGNTSINSRFLSKKKFTDLLKLLMGRVEFVSIESLFLKNYETNLPKLAITFDDGYRNNLTHLLPIIEQYNVPVSIYITTIGTVGEIILWTDLIDISRTIDASTFFSVGKKIINYKRKGYKFANSDQYLKSMLKDQPYAVIKSLTKSLPGKMGLMEREDLFLYWNLLTEADILQLSKSPMVTIGSHGQLHTSLAKLSVNDAMDELIISKDFLEGIINSEVSELSYPFGEFSNDLASVAYDLGFTRQLSTLSNIKNDSPAYVKYRMINNPHISNLNQLLCLSKGGY